MGELKNLGKQEALDKLRELALDIGICMFCTELGQRPFSTRPMSLKEVDDKGNLWFLSSADSEKNFEIRQDDQVQLVFSKSADSHFLNVFGEADIITDQKKTEDLWSGFAKAWFTEGKYDPKITIIRVKPLEAYYWDTKDGKLISLVKIAAAAVTGKTADGGVEGKLALS